ncbi:hypothetical protein KY348_02745 [Candidatus Woesearchaeota archaeon]|nr:hypothetical protein [Candidatus Woesearchaeota archaeon]
MGFKSEEEIEEWYLTEKQGLEDEFMKKINKDKGNIPKHRERFDADMKRLIARYEAEHFKLMDANKKKGVLKEE